MSIAAPKRIIINEIIRNFDGEVIRGHFNIAESTQLGRRLDDMLKSDLVLFLQGNGVQGIKLLKDLEKRYPLYSTPTLFLPKISQDSRSLQMERLESLASSGHMDKYLYGENRPVRSVYIGPNPEYVTDIGLIEIPILYERKMQYFVSDPNRENYGEQQTLYSLERGLIWVSEQYSHAVICCSGISAVNAILGYGRIKLDFNWWLPNMSKEMYQRLTSSGQPRSTTFSPRAMTSDPTVTLSAQGLGELSLYKEYDQNPDHDQVSAFLSGSDSILPSYGVSQRSGRVWSPHKLNKTTLRMVANEKIKVTENELSEEYENSIERYVAYHAPAIISIGGKPLNQGRSREVFIELVTTIIKALRNGNNNLQMHPELLRKLVAHQKTLRFEVASKFECSNCGDVLGICPDCNNPYDVAMESENLYLKCSECKTLLSDEIYICECRTENEIVGIENYIQLYPSVELLEAIEAFLGLMEEVIWNHVFFVDGYVLNVFEKRELNLPGRVFLHDLRKWKTIGKIHQRRVESKRKPFVEILNKTKEKCRRDNKPPTKKLCESCLASTIVPDQLTTERELCLPRIMGLAINQGFDGIHHGHEIADIKYEDVLVSSGQKVKLGIHLKSRKYRTPVKGLGRSVEKIKALYTQVFYSAYQTLTGDIDFDVIGVSIPNRIKSDVIDSFQNLLNKLGFSLIILDEDDWLKITDSVQEQLLFQVIDE